MTPQLSYGNNLFVSFISSLRVLCEPLNVQSKGSQRTRKEDTNTLRKKQEMGDLKFYL